MSELTLKFHDELKNLYEKIVMETNPDSIDTHALSRANGLVLKAIGTLYKHNLQIKAIMTKIGAP